MGRDSGIAWTHHTFNPWWGCAKVYARDVETVRATYRIGERPRPCPGCLKCESCSGCEALEFVGDLCERCGRARQPIYVSCDGSGVLPARKKGSKP